MPNTTDNFDIPFLDGTELVRDYPQFSQDLAEAIDDALSSDAAPVPFYRYVDTVYFTSSGPFEKADYPWLRAIGVKCQGAGGGSGGIAATGAGVNGASPGGAGGAYGETFITDIAGLDASVTVTRGGGGAGGAAGANAGSNGVASSFGSLVIADGGQGGRAGVATSGAAVTPGRPATTGTTGADLSVPGGGGGGAAVFAGVRALFGVGGGSHLGAEQPPEAGGNGVDGVDFGGGAGGAASAPNTAARTGGTGGNGIVIVDLYA